MLRESMGINERDQSPAAIFAKRDEDPGRQESQLRKRISARAPRSDQHEGDKPR